MFKAPILKSILLSQFPEITFGFSLKGNDYTRSQFGFNMSFSVGDDENVVKENRKKFFETLGFREEQICFIRQEHTDIIATADEAKHYGIADAIITNKKNIALTVIVADCVPIFIYDKTKKIIAAVHSGWRGTAKKILWKTLLKLKEEFNCNPQDIIAYIGPCISQENYEVSLDAAIQFDKKYLKEKENGKFLLDLKTANRDFLLEFGVPLSNLQISNLCSYEEIYLHSYRRDGKLSGRSIGLIGLK